MKNKKNCSIWDQIMIGFIITAMVILIMIAGGGIYTIIDEYKSEKEEIESFNSGYKKGYSIGRDNGIMRGCTQAYHQYNSKFNYSKCIEEASQ